MSMMMSKVTSLLLTVTDFYKDLNPSTLSGAIDIVCISLDNGELMASPFHVRFGKLQLLRSHEKVVTIAINNATVDSIQMKLGDAGEAFFVKESDHAAPLHLATSPISCPAGSSASSSDTPEPLDLDFSEPNHRSSVDFANTPKQAPDSLLLVATPERVLPESPASSPDSFLIPNSVERHAVPSIPSVQAPRSDELDDSSNPQSITSTPSIPTPCLQFHPTANLFSANDPSLITPQPANPPIIHHFSDTELDPPHHHLIKKNLNGPLSDTELEFHEFNAVAQSTPSASNWIWGWGKFPTFGSSSVSALNQPITLPKSSQSVISPPNGNLNQVSDDSGDDQCNKAPVALSLAGYRPSLTQAEFDAKQITYEQFVAQSDSLLSSPTLVVCLEGRFYPWSVAGAMLVGLLAFGKPLPTATIDHMLTQTPALYSTTNPRKSSWKFWSRSSADPAASSDVQPATPASLLGQFHDTASIMAAAELNASSSITIPTTASAPTRLKTVGRTWSEIPKSLPDRIDTSMDLSGRSHSFSELEPLADLCVDGNDVDGYSPRGDSKPAKYYVKSLRLTSDELKNLNLKPGCNHITFTVASSLQGTAVCHSRIFLWRSNERVVISDIDGTITKSDALGHIFTMLGRDWTHSGVASLYTQIRNNGYQILYLTSRAIGQAQYTRNYLNKVEQGTYQLPDGPVFLSPDRLMAAFAREVIQRRPEEFKVACLRDIRALFAPDAKTPFYAGFGNRHTDAYSYRAVGVPAWRIYTINPAGQLKRELLEGYKATYLDLRELVDQIFPPVMAHRYHVDAEFNDWTYWRRRLPVVSIEALGLLDEDDEDDEEDVGERNGSLHGTHDGALMLAQLPGSLNHARHSNRVHQMPNALPNYDGSDEGSGEDEDNEHDRMLATRVAEIAAFPYI